MHPKLIVITGSSGVGKSTLAKALQEELLPDQWFHLSVDSIFECLPRSVVFQVNHHNDHALVDSKAIIGAAHSCAITLMEAGHRVVFDAVILSERGAQALLAAFAAFDPWLIELTCDWAELERRTLARGDRTLAEAWHGHQNARGHLPAHQVVDSTGVSAEHLAKQLVALLRSMDNAG